MKSRSPPPIATESSDRATPVTWTRRYRVKSYIRSALWIIPLVAVFLEEVTAVLAIDQPHRLLQAWDSEISGPNRSAIEPESFA